MSTTGKKREGSVITVTNDEASGTQLFHVAGVGTMALYHRPEPAENITGLSAAVIAHAAYHGMEQRIRDAGALGYDDEKKRYATPQEKFDAMRLLVDYYNAGATEWNLRGGVSEGGLLYRALMRQKPDRDPTAVKAFIKSKDAATRRKLLDSDALIEIVRAIRKEDGSAVDTDALLAELDGE